MSKSGITLWPDGWPRCQNWTNDPCDALVGPCICRAWHAPGEFELRNGELFRYGEKVACLPASK